MINFTLKMRALLMALLCFGAISASAQIDCPDSPTVDSPDNLYYILEWGIEGENLIDAYLAGEVSDELIALLALEYEDDLTDQGFFQPTVEQDECFPNAEVVFDFEFTGSAQNECPVVANIKFFYTITDGEGTEFETIIIDCDIFDTTPPTISGVEDYTVQCLEEVLPPNATIEDSCDDNPVLIDFISNTGDPIEACELSVAYGPGHDWAFWLPTLEQAGSDDFIWDENGGKLDFFADNTAHLYGTVFNDTNLNGVQDDDENEAWIVDVWFENGQDWTDWSSQGRWYKDDLGFGAVNHVDWMYYELVGGISTMTGAGDFAGDMLSLYHKPASYFFGFQCGLGANNKNGNEGFSGWYSYTGFVGGEAVEGHGDINVDKTCEPINLEKCPNDTEVTYMFRAEDSCGNVAIATQVVTVEDTTPPTFDNPPSDMELSCENWPIPLDDCVATDNCEGVITYVGPEESIENGNCPNEFTVTRTWGAIDECGNAATHTQTIYVYDDQPVVLVGVPEAEITVECDEVPEAANVTGEDNCSEFEIVYSEIRENGDCDYDYTLTRTWIAEDACGNISSFVQTINVQDTEGPVFEDYEQIFAVSCEDIDTTPTPEATDNCGDVTITYEDELNSGGCMGVITRTITAVDECGNETVIVQYITLTDDVAPVIECIADETYECDEEIPTAVDPEAYDNCGLDVTITMEESMEGDSCLKTITRTWTATDYCGNESSCSQVITVQDTTAPSITAADDATVECGDELPVPAAETADNCNEVSWIVEATMEPTCGDAFIMTRTYTATDACGNSSTDTQIITVVDTTPPTIEAAADATVECGDELPVPAADVADTCGNATWTVESSREETCGDTYIMTRTYTATDDCGNTATDVQIITVVDTTDPVITCPADLTHECDEAPDYGVATATDTCGDVTVDFVDSETGDSCERVITRTWTATDACENTASCVQTITIVDTTAPTVTAAPDATVECGEELPTPDAAVTDNCNEAGWTVEATMEPTCGDAFIMTRTYTATDACGNSSTDTQIITVVDTTPPTIEAADDATVECGDELPVPAADVADTCGNATWTVESSREETCGDTYIMTRTYTATDDCGNTATDVQIITVVDTTDPVIACPADLTHECDETPDYGVATATDTCGDATVDFVDLETGDSCELVITRTWTATDACENTASCVQTITIVDTTAPVISGPVEIDVPCDDVAEGGVFVEVTDNCNEFTVEHTDVRVSGGCAGQIIRTCVATDACGNSSEFVQILDLYDDVAPEILCSDDYTVECDEEYGFTDPQYADNCSEDIILTSEDSEAGDSCERTVTRTWTATDECGNNSSCSQTITIVDTTAPVITCPEDVSHECDELVDYGEATVTDNCNDVTITSEDLVEGDSCETTIRRTWTATDACGNASTCVQSIYIYDATAPVITCPADVEHECDVVVDYGEATATDNCNDVTITSSDVETGDSCEKTITRTWTATDACENASTCVQTIYIYDTTAPVITGENELDAPCDDIDQNILVDVTDNCNEVGIEITFEDLFVSGGCVGQVIRTYTATDICGNASEFVQILDLYDDIAPEILCSADYTVECDEEYDFTAPEYSDNCSEVTLTSEDTESGDSCEKTKTRTWTATDECGNTSSCSQTVRVVDTTAPVITCPEDVTLECDATATDFGTATATDNCNEVTITSEDAEAGDACRRTITRTWTATDTCGNASSCVQTIVYVDTTAPVITCPADVSHECDEAPAYGEATATDNCNEVTITSEDIESGDSCERVITRTWTATDACENASSCVQTIVIYDTTAPTITCESDVELECGTLFEFNEPVYSDNCNDVTLTFVDFIIDGICVNGFGRTWIATDACGNESSCSQAVTFVDTTAPVITCPADVAHECDDSTVAYGEATATDNCHAVEIDFSDVVTGDSCETVITRTWTADDGCGNTSSCVQTITISDTTAPVITCPADVSHECDELVEYGSATATDNCNEVTITSSDDVTGDDCDRTITRTWTATDVCGNASSCVQTITIYDTTAPEITCPADVSHECSDVVDYGEATATDNCNAVTITSSDVESGDSCETVITRTWTATDACDNASSCVQTIVIYDATAPVFTSVPTDMSYECYDDVPVQVDPTATDNCQVATVVCERDEDIDECGNGEIYISCVATDGCGNETRVDYTITIEDTTAPELTLEPADLELDCEDEVPAPPVVEAVDNCDDDPEVVYTETLIGELPEEGSIADCTLSTPASNCDPSDPAWSLKLFEFPGYEFFTTVDAQFVEYDDHTAHLSGRVQAVNNPAAFFDIDVHFENGLDWNDWSNQAFPTSFKDDCDIVGNEYLDWTYYIMTAGSATLTGAGDLAGSFFTLTHAPINFYYGYQVGVGANNVDNEYGNGGWFYGTGLLIDSSTQTQVELEGFQGDFAFDADCCPQYIIERSWYAVDCTGNVSDTWTQTISFEDQGDDAGIIIVAEETINESNDEVVISDVFPNPVRDRAQINYSVVNTSMVTLDVLDMNGNLVSVLYKGTAEGGVTYQAMFNAAGIESGVYMVRLATDKSAKFERIVLAK